VPGDWLQVRSRDYAGEAREAVPDVQARPAARPIYHHKRDSIKAHLTIVLAALAASRWIQEMTGWPIRNFVRTAAAAAPCRSRSAPTPSPPLTPYTTASVTSSTASTAA
jgi:hypothetical protein